MDNPEPGRRDSYISVTISSQAYLILIKALVTVCISKGFEHLIPDAKSRYKRWKQKTMWGNRCAVLPACISFISTCTELPPYDFSCTEFSSPKGLINLKETSPEFQYTATRWQRSGQTQKSVSKDQAKGWNRTLSKWCARISIKCVTMNSHVV